MAPRRRGFGDEGEGGLAMATGGGLQSPMLGMETGGGFQAPTVPGMMPPEDRPREVFPQPTPTTPPQAQQPQIPVDVTVRQPAFPPTLPQMPSPAAMQQGPARQPMVASPAAPMIFGESPRSAGLMGSAGGLTGGGLGIAGRAPTEQSEPTALMLQLLRLARNQRRV